MHPQLAATLLGRPLPPQPGESGAPFEPERLPLVEPRTGDQAAQGCRHPRVVNNAWALGDSYARYHTSCRDCGRVLSEEFKHGALTAVAGRMFRR